MESGNTRQTKGDRARYHILKTAQRLFSEKSYDSVSTRMIAAEANCSQSAIAFYFTTKENLCRCVGDDIIQYQHGFYDPIVDSIREAEQKGPLSRADALKYLQMYLTMQIRIAFDQKNRCAINFCMRGSAFPEEVIEPLENSINDRVRVPMARLIMAISPMEYSKAIVYSQALTNCIMLFPFMGNPAVSGNNYNAVKQHLLDFTMDTVLSF